MSPRNLKAGQRRLIDISAEAESWQESDGRPPEETEYEQMFPISETVGYIQRFVMDDHDQIRQWAVVQVRRVGGRWQRVAVYDTCHDKGVHVHFYDRNGVEFAETALRSVDSYDDLVDGLDYAVDRVVMAWRENERRSDRGY